MLRSITRTSLNLEQVASMCCVVLLTFSSAKKCLDMNASPGLLRYRATMQLASLTHSLLKSPKALMHDLHDVPLEIRVHEPQIGAIRCTAPGRDCSTKTNANLSSVSQTPYMGNGLIFEITVLVKVNRTVTKKRKTSRAHKIHGPGIILLI